MERLKFFKYYDLSKLRSSQGHLSTGRQFLEMALLYALKGIGPGYYHSAQMWNKDKTWQYKFGWLSEKNYRKRLYQYNPRPYQKISMNKLPEKALLSLFKVPTPEFYGWFHPVHGRDAYGNLFCSGDDIIRVLTSKNIQKFCIKELEGWGGKGFQAFEVIRKDGKTVLRSMQGDQAVLPVQDHFNNIQCPHEGLAFEAYINQHPVMRALNPSSLNTIRILVVWPYDNDYPKVVGAFVRIGRAGSLVDNTTAGGLAALVDIDTGKVGSAHFKPPHPDIFRIHPDHGSQIYGVIIPHWDGVKDLLKKTMPIFPNLRFCGFDIAISVDGPTIVELNVEADKSGLMQVGICMNDAIPKINIINEATAKSPFFQSQESGDR